MADETKRPSSGASSGAGRSNRRGGRRRYFRNKGEGPRAAADAPLPRESERRESERRESERREGGRREGDRREGAGRDATGRDPTNREGNGRDSGGREGAGRDGGRRSTPNNQRSAQSGQRSSAPGQRSGQGGQRGGSQPRGNAQLEAQEARRARRRRRRSSARGPEREAPRTETITSASDLGYKPPSSVFIYTYVSHSDLGERYEPRVEHFSSVGRKLEDYQIDLSKITSEDGGIRMTKISVDFGDFDFDAPETEEERLAAEKAEAERALEATQRQR